jgi:hypothetical protein
VISYHSRDIGVACLLFCNHHKDNGHGHVQLTCRFTLSILIKVVKVAVCECVIVVAKRLKVLATCREIW